MPGSAGHCRAAQQKQQQRQTASADAPARLQLHEPTPADPPRPTPSQPTESQPAQHGVLRFAVNAAPEPPAAARPCACAADGETAQAPNLPAAPRRLESDTPRLQNAPLQEPRMTNFASPKSTQAASGPAARAGPAGSRHKNPRQASTPTLAGGTELPSPKPEPMPGTPAAEKPVKAATWSAGPKRRNFQRNYASGPRGGPTSASAAAEHAEHLDDFEPSLSKNSRVSLNHLLNFRLPPRQFTSAGYSSSSSRRTANYGSGSWDKMTRDRYLNAKYVAVCLLSIRPLACQLTCLLPLFKQPICCRGKWQLRGKSPRSRRCRRLEFRRASPDARAAGPRTHLPNLPRRPGRTQMHAMRACLLLSVHPPAFERRGKGKPQVSRVL